MFLLAKLARRLNVGSFKYLFLGTSKLPNNFGVVVFLDIVLLSTEISRLPRLLTTPFTSFHALLTDWLLQIHGSFRQYSFPYGTDFGLLTLMCETGEFKTYFEALDGLEREAEVGRTSKPEKRMSKRRFSAKEAKRLLMTQCNEMLRRPSPSSGQGSAIVSANIDPGSAPFACGVMTMAAEEDDRNNNNNNTSNIVCNNNFFFYINNGNDNNNLEKITSEEEIVDHYAREIHILYYMVIHTKCV